MADEKSVALLEEWGFSDLIEKFKGTTLFYYALLLFIYLYFCNV